MTVLTADGTTNSFESFLFGKYGSEQMTDLAVNVKQSFTTNADAFFRLLQNQYINP